MDIRKPFAHSAKNVVLIVEDDVMVRTALAEYLRHCGYQVIETAGEQEAMQICKEADIPINVLFVASVAFGLMQWVRQNRPGIHVILAGTPEKAAHAAGVLCETGPHLKKPYEPQQVIEWIKRLQATKPE